MTADQQIVQGAQDPRHLQRQHLWLPHHLDQHLQAMSRLLRPSIVVLWATFCVFTSPCVSCCRTVLWVFRGLLGPSCPMDLWMPMCHSIKKQLEQRHAVKQTCDCSCSDRISTHSCVICIASQLEPRHAAKQPCECSCSDRIMCSTHGLWHATVISRVKTCCQESL